jgi:hypothetical protein
MKNLQFTKFLAKKILSSEVQTLRKASSSPDSCSKLEISRRNFLFFCGGGGGLEPGSIDPVESGIGSEAMANNIVYLVRCPFREIFRQNLNKKTKNNIIE